MFRSKVKGGTGALPAPQGSLVSRGTSTITTIDADGSIHTRDEATCKGKIRLAKRGRH